MTNFEKNIKESAREYSLSSDEKARMKRVISEYARHKPLPAGRQGSAEYVYASYSWISILYRPVAAALVLVLVTGSGVSYAAETALPGDILYGVKTAVNEPVRVALATDAEAKAEVQIELAERRIEEATTLAADGRLDEETEDDLAAAFEAHAAAVAESIAEADQADATTSVELAARFENRLAAHEMVLAEVGFELDSEEESEFKSHRLADAIRITNSILAEARFERSPVAAAYDTATSMAMMAADAPVEADATAMTMSLATSEPVAEVTMEARTAKMAVAPSPESMPAPDARTLSRMESAAERSLKNAQKAFRSAKSLSADAKARATADITLADEQLAHGKELLEADADAEAFLAIQESIRISEQAFVFLKAAPALEKARSRNVRNQRIDTNGSQKGENVEASVDVSLPGVSVDATGTSPIGAEPRSDSDDGPTNDGGEDDGSEPIDDNGGQREDGASDDGLIQGQIKVDLSL